MLITSAIKCFPLIAILNIYIYNRMEVIAEDIQKLEEDVANIKCNPIIKFIKDLFKCFEDSI